MGMGVVPPVPPLVPIEAQGMPGVRHNLDGWVMSAALRAEAIIEGVRPDEIDQRLADLRRGPIGGTRGIFPHMLDDYVRSQFGKWKTWSETDRAKALPLRQAAPWQAETSATGGWAPDQSHRLYAEEREIPQARVAEILGGFYRSKAPQRLTHPQANKAFGKLLAQEVRATRAANGKSAVAS